MMHTRITIIGILLVSCCLEPASAEGRADHAAEHMKREHGGAIFHAFEFEADWGDGDVASWDLDGWIGTDEDKLWLKSEGEHAEGEWEKAELWALYSRNISTFWDAQVGVRYDVEPWQTGYFAVGLNGLAPYFFETEAHLFISEDGDVSARLRQENEFLLTQKIVFQPYAELNLYAQDVDDQEIGAGFSSGEIGLQTRFEITRKFAPYIDIRYERLLGDTASIAEAGGEDKDDVVGAIGLRLMF